MAERLITVPCDRLETGMYVAELDRSWLHTPFAGPGLFVSSRQQIESLRCCCNYVYIDPARSEAGVLAERPRLPLRPAGAANDEPDIVEAVLDELTRLIAAVVRDARRGRDFDLRPVRRCAELVTQIALEQADRCLWSLHLNRGAGLLYRRSIGTALHAVLLGRHLGLAREQLHALAIGGLLLDIGKIAVPVPILAKPARLTKGEKQFVERHVWQGFSLLHPRDSVDRRVIDMVLGHHERIDGSGYPRRLRGTAIPLYARIAAVADSYDALTLDRGYAKAISAHDALKTLHRERGRRYDSALVDEFIHAIGIYPTGTRVRMMDGRVGVVCRQDPAWPLRPAVMLLDDAPGRPAPEPRLLGTDAGGLIDQALPPEPLPERFRRPARELAAAC